MRAEWSARRAKMAKTKQPRAAEKIAAAAEPFVRTGVSPLAFVLFSMIQRDGICALNRRVLIEHGAEETCHSRSKKCNYGEDEYG